MTSMVGAVDIWTVRVDNTRQGWRRSRAGETLESTDEPIETVTGARLGAPGHGIRRRHRAGERRRRGAAERGAPAAARRRVAASGDGDRQPESTSAATAGSLADRPGRIFGC